MTEILVSMQIIFLSLIHYEKQPAANPKNAQNVKLNIIITRSHNNHSQTVNYMAPWTMVKSLDTIVLIEAARTHFTELCVKVMRDNVGTSQHTTRGARVVVRINTAGYGKISRIAHGRSET